MDEALRDPERLRILEATGLLDSPAEAAFDRITKLAARVLRVPVSLVSLVTSERQFFKSTVGLPEPWATTRESPLSHSFCQHVVHQAAPLVIPDAVIHPLVRNNLAVCDIGVRAYAGAPLITHEGITLGALCVIDGSPRNWTDNDIELLEDFAALVTTEIESRRAASAKLKALVALRRVEANFKTFLDHCPAGAYLKDELGRFTYVNKAMMSFFPDARQWVGRTNDMIFPPNIARELSRIDDDARKKPGGVQVEETVPIQDGTPNHWLTFKFPIIETDGSHTLACMSLNVTELKNNEARLRENEAQLRIALTSGGMGTFKIDWAANKAWVDEQAAKLLSIGSPGPGEMSLDDCFAGVHVDDRVDLILKFSAKHTNIAPNTMEFRLNAPDGSIRWLCVDGGPLDGSLNQSVGVLFDITSRKKIERDLLAAKEAAEAANIAKGQFLAHMSHEIRTPLTAMLGYTDLLRDPSHSLQNRQEFADTISRNGHHLLDVINDILDFSKIDAGAMSIENIETDVAALIRCVANLMEQRANDKGLKLALHVEPNFPLGLQTDPTRLRQIMLNLVGNAIKFTTTGSVTIKVGLRKSLEDLRAATLSVDVIDTGIGMTEDIRRNLFRPFAQGDGSYARVFGGTGLGLAISHRLARMLGGDLSVTSSSGMGSTFSLKVPVGVTDGLNQHTNTATSSTSAQLVGTVLLAEDSVDNRKLFTHYLRKLGLTVETVETGKDAVIRALDAVANKTPYSLILMDCQMPVMDGYTATRELRLAGYTGAIVALTAHALPEDRAAALAAGSDAFLTKPLDLPLFNEIVTKAIKDAA